MIAWEFHRLAEIEFDDIVERYFTANTLVSQRFATEFQNAMDLICRLPDSFPRYDHWSRFSLLRGFPYVIIYRPTNPIVVVAVAHQRRRKDDWKKDRKS
jgi:plasmid stabilization system protein ParE